MGIRDVLKLRRKKRGDNGSSPSPSSAEIAAQEVQQSDNELCQNVPDILHYIEPVTTGEPTTKYLPQVLQSFICIEAQMKLKGEDTKLVDRYEKVIEKLIQEDSFDENGIQQKYWDCQKYSPCRFPTKEVKWL